MQVFNPENDYGNIFPNVYLVGVTPTHVRSV